MEISLIISSLSRHQAIFQSYFEGLDPKQYNWKPEGSEMWSLKEILCHLLDEERLDFRPRIDRVLNQQEPEPIDPPAWVNKYASQDYDHTLDSFLDERSQSIKFLKGVDKDTWKNRYLSPVNGTNRSALFYLENWLAHDLLHLRQCTKMKYLNLKHMADNPIEYAGNWL